LSGQVELSPRVQALAATLRDGDGGIELDADTLNELRDACSRLSQLERSELTTQVVALALIIEAKAPGRCAGALAQLFMLATALVGDAARAGDRFSKVGLPTHGVNIDGEQAAPLPPSQDPQKLWK
jgi:hypothetical protein